MSKDVMSKIRAGDVWRELERVLKEYRVETYEVHDKRPHPVLEVTYCGVTRGMTFSGSPSSRFTCKAEAADLRRLLKEMQMAAISGPAPVVVEKRDPVKAITFRGATIDTVMHDGEPHVALKPIVEGMGLAWNAQLERIKRDTVLSEGVRVIRIPSRGGDQDATVVPLKMLNGFLFGIDENRVKPELREGVIAYKRECYDALSRYWLHGAAVRAEVEEEKAEISSHELSRGALAAIGGIVRAVNGKQVSELRDELVNMIIGLADRISAPAFVETAPSYDLSGTVTAREMVDMAGVDRADRVRGTTGIVTRRMKDFCLARGLRVERTPEHIDPDRRWRFPRPIANEWLFGDHLGAEVIRSHISKRSRGSHLRLVDHSSLPLSS